MQKKFDRVKNKEKFDQVIFRKSIILEFGVLPSLICSLHGFLTLFIVADETYFFKEIGFPWGD
jgi:hypothetical protein